MCSAMGVGDCEEGLTAILSDTKPRFDNHIRSQTAIRRHEDQSVVQYLQVRIRFPDRCAVR